MSSRADNAITAAQVRPGATRRRHDAGASRQALLDAADALFEERGYDAATIRDIGERAGVDAALIARYFGSKEGLYLATLEQGRAPTPNDAMEVLERMLSRSEQRRSGPVPRAMVSPTLTDPMREQIREIIGRRLVDPLAAQLGEQGVPDARLRVELLLAMAIGVALTRAGGTLPTLAEAPLDDLLTVLRPLVDALHGGPA
jgi:AcrR family transcriptional regulator